MISTRAAALARLASHPSASSRASMTPGGRRFLSSFDGSIALRVPSGALRGRPSDVPDVLPILAQLSRGAMRGTPRWVSPPFAAAGPDLVQRKRSASFLEITYPFASDPELLQIYMVHDAVSLRGGMFLEELDAFSADCAFRHADGYNPARPLTVVTAAHDGLSIFGDGQHSPLSALHDLRLRGAVVSVGNSSMEVQTDVLRVRRSSRGAAGAPDEDGDEQEEYLGSCFTVMVARERESFGKACPAPPRLAPSRPLPPLVPRRHFPHGMAGRSAPAGRRRPPDRGVRGGGGAARRDAPRARRERAGAQAALAV